MPQVENNHHIIALGASAGGMEAISSFFDNTPLDGVAYVIVQHMSPDHISHMGEILARHSKLEIVEVSNHITVEKNKVYIIPNTKFMTIKAGKLILTEKLEMKAPHMTIDQFFISLAEERGDRSIGIILSGTGRDGSKGIEAIYEAGGMTMVQSPETAKFKAMPTCAISTGFPDFVLSPEEMPREIEAYIHGELFNSDEDIINANIKEETLRDILTLIKSSLPLDFSDYKRPTIVRRIKRKMVDCGFDIAEKYYNFLQNSPNELESLANSFLIGVTSFFRDREAFDIIENTIIPELINKKSDGDGLKIWVAGCSSGEEAYSLAILVKEYLTEHPKNLDVKIFATDINKGALDRASKGIYNESTLQETISNERLEKHFNKEGSTYKIKPEIRKMLIFAQHDLIKNPPYCNIDLISCRNLLIYMNSSLQKKIFSVLHFALQQGGILFLGSSENANILKNNFSEISKKWKIFKNTKLRQTLRFDTFSPPVMDLVKQIPMQINKTPDVLYAKNEMIEDIDAIIQEEFRFSGVCIDEHLKVVHSFGDLSKYLKQEIFNFNLIELLLQPLAMAFGAAVEKAKLNKKVLIKRIKLDNNGKTIYVNLLVKPFFVGKTYRKMILVLFSEDTRKSVNDEHVEVYDKDYHTSVFLNHLQEDLKETRQNLELAYERIESSNENMQSFNEELLSANEEMQSANEELQSVNEELQTINTEHQLKIKELTDLNDDLNNYFRSNVNGQLFVDNDLLLKKYSPGAVKHINIKERDIGRPISNITTNIKFETLVEDIKTVILTGETVVKEVESSENKIYQVMTIPYIRQFDNQADGAIITFYDITEFKKIQAELATSNKSLLRINEDLDNFVYGASHDLIAPILNIEGMLAVLNKKMDMDDPMVKKFTKEFDSSIDQFKSVIKDLAVIGKIEADMLTEYRIESFEELVNDIRVSILDKIKISKTAISTDFQQKEIKFPRKNLRSILVNLISNAVKFKSPERNSEIVIRTEKIPGYTLLSIKDNGIGMQESQVESIFKMYRQLNPDIEGQGIGLYLVNKIMDAAEGKVEVESEVGVGSTFKIFFKN